MSMSPTLEAKAASLLRYEIWRHLDAAEFHVLKDDPLETDEDLETAGALIENLVDVIRKLVPDKAEPALETAFSMLRDAGAPFGELVKRYDF